jgi:hypothetical protein
MGAHCNRPYHGLAIDPTTGILYGASYLGGLSGSGVTRINYPYNLDSDQADLGSIGASNPALFVGIAFGPPPPFIMPEPLYQYMLN